MKRRNFIAAAAVVTAGGIGYFKWTAPSTWSKKDLEAFFKLHAASGLKVPPDLEDRLMKKGLPWPIEESDLARVQELCQNDLARGQVVQLNGWPVAQTEVEIWLTAYQKR